jgi:hypothetical protein
MAATLSTGSPKLGKKPSSNFVILDQNEDDEQATVTCLVSPAEHMMRETLQHRLLGTRHLIKANLTHLGFSGQWLWHHQRYSIASRYAGKYSA